MDISQERLFEKLRKIQALAERGNAGEKESAKNKLDQLLKEYGLTLDDITSSETEFAPFSYKNKLEKRLILQIHSHVVDSTTSSYYERKGSKKIEFKLTPSQSAEIKMLFSIYRKAFKKEVEMLFSAFVHKHNIFSSTKADTRDEEPDPIDFRELARLQQMIGGLNDVNIPRAMIEG